MVVPDREIKVSPEDFGWIGEVVKSYLAKLNGAVVIAEKAYIPVNIPTPATLKSLSGFRVTGTALWCGQPYTFDLQMVKVGSDWVAGKNPQPNIIRKGKIRMLPAHSQK